MSTKITICLILYFLSIYIPVSYTHLENGKIKAYLRALQPGVSYENASLGRVLVSPDARGKGYAKAIVTKGVEYILNNFNTTKITIGAQEYLKNFYSEIGFKPISEVYDEDGIPHLDMTFEK